MSTKVKVLIAIGSLLLVVGIAALTAFLISTSNPSDNSDKVDGTSNADETLNEELSSAEAKKKVKQAGENESNGDTKAAIDNYREAMRHYQNTGDKAGEEAVRLQIQYLESLPEESTEVEIYDGPIPEEESTN